MDSRKVFDSIPEQFDKWRPRYCPALFSDVVRYAELQTGKVALELGPGTGQATEPILKTGCSYLGIELGENLARYMKSRFRSYSNFEIMNADFETYDFGQRQFDFIYSAATIQWIPEHIGFPKVYGLLKSNGTFAMMFTKTDYRRSDEALYFKIQKVYQKHFHPQTPYTCSIEYGNVGHYGFTDIECRYYHNTREYNADGYVSLIGTHADHITLPEPLKSYFYAGIKDAILSAGNHITLTDTIVLYLARKP
jgi:SAM-dependent methyltransferase